MIYLGKMNQLTVLKKSKYEYILTDEEGNKVTMPVHLTETSPEEDKPFEVFVFKDANDRLIATQKKPKAQVGQFAGLKVISITKAGAFMDWGVPKDLFVPHKEQRYPMEKGKYYLVYIYIDEQTDRIAASSKLEKFVTAPPEDLKEGDEVELMIEAKTELGYNAIVNHSFRGLIYENEIFTEVRVGRPLKGYVKHIRGDGKVDLALQKSGYFKVDGQMEIILEKLNEAGGFLPLNDKSNPAAIYDALAMSKKSFKTAIGKLYKERKISIGTDGIHLIS